MANKNSFEYVKEFSFSLGYIIKDTSYNGAFSKATFEDCYGYKYLSTFNAIE